MLSSALLRLTLGVRGPSDVFRSFDPVGCPPPRSASGNIDEADLNMQSFSFLGNTQLPSALRSDAACCNSLGPLAAQ